MNAEKHSDIHDRSLFQLGDWHIVKCNMYAEGVVGGQRQTCYAVHTGCEHNNWSEQYSAASPRDCCYRCGDVVPDELQALVALHAWGWEEQ